MNYKSQYDGYLNYIIFPKHFDIFNSKSLCVGTLIVLMNDIDDTKLCPPTLMAFTRIINNYINHNYIVVYIIIIN